MPFSVRCFVRPMPQPNGARKIFQRCNHSNEAVRFGRIVSRAQLQNHLLLRAEVHCLNVTPLAQIPEVKAVSVLACQQQLRIHAILNHVRRAPLARDGNVISQMPGEVVAKILRAALHFPSSERLKRVMIQRENSSGTVAAWRSKSADVDAIRSAVNCVWSAVAGSLGKPFLFNDLHDLWLARIAFSVNDVNSRRAEARHNQIASLHMGMRSVGAEG